MLYELLWLYENPSIHLWELLGGENWRESEIEFCPGEMEAPKVLPYLAFILRFFLPSMYQIQVRPLLSNGWLTSTSTGCLKKTEFYRIEHLKFLTSPSFFQGPLLSKARRGAHRQHTEFKIYFHGNRSTLQVIFIGPESDHCLLLSLTDWLTDSLTDWLTPV